VRNTLLLAASQAVLTTVGQAVFILAALVSFMLSGSAGVAGLASGLVWGGRVLVVYQSGRLMDMMGRRKVLTFGILVTAVGTLVLAAAVARSSLSEFLSGLLIFGIGSGITQQARVAVADMFPPRRRGEGIGYLMTGNVAGAILSTIFTAAMILIATIVPVDANVLILLTGSLILFASTALIIAVSPEPKEIAQRIHEFYPNEGRSENPMPSKASISILRVLLFFPMFAAFLGSSLSQGDMTMLMSLVSLILHQHNVSLTLISVAITAHIIGMFALSVPLGSLSDKIGRKWVVVAGGLVLSLGAFLTPSTGHYGIITVGIVLVGVGWSAINVSSAAMISDLSEPGIRGRIMGLNDMTIALAAIALPVAGGVVIGSLGFEVFSIFGFAVAIPIVLVAISIREIRPGLFKPHKQDPRRTAMNDRGPS
jgi:MFS family permease